MWYVQYLAGPNNTTQFNGPGGALIYEEAAEANSMFVVETSVAGGTSLWINGVHKITDPSFGFDHVDKVVITNEGVYWDNIKLETIWSPVWVAPPVDFTWNIDSFGEWTTHDNWTPSGGPPGDVGRARYANHTATFGSAITSDRTVITETAVSVRAITFDNSNTYSIAGNGSVNLIAATVTELSTAISTLQGTHQFQAVVNLHNNTTVSIASASSLEFVNRLKLNNNTLTKTGEGTLVISNTLNTGGGTVNCAQGTCSGTGTIGGDLNNDGGTISPGNSSLWTQTQVPEPAASLLLVIGSALVLLHRP